MKNKQQHLPHQFSYAIRLFFVNTGSLYSKVVIPDLFPQVNFNVQWYN